MVEELRQYQAWLANESARVDAALAALGSASTSSPNPPPSKPSGLDRRSNNAESSSKSTSEMVMALLRDEPNLELTAQAAVDKLSEKGWETESRDPVNAMRAALSRLAERGELRRVGSRRSGKYQLNALDLDDEPSPESAQGRLDDDEPPF